MHLAKAHKPHTSYTYLVSNTFISHICFVKSKLKYSIKEDAEIGLLNFVLNKKRVYPRQILILKTTFKNSFLSF